MVPKKKKHRPRYNRSADRAGLDVPYSVRTYTILCISRANVSDSERREYYLTTSVRIGRIFARFRLGQIRRAPSSVRNTRISHSIRDDVVVNVYIYIYTTIIVAIERAFVHVERDLFRSKYAFSFSRQSARDNSKPYGCKRFRIDLRRY